MWISFSNFTIHFSCIIPSVVIFYFLAHWYMSHIYYLFYFIFWCMWMCAVCMYIHVCAWEYMYVQVHSPVHVHAEARGSHPMSSSIFFLNSISHWTLNLTFQLDWLASGTPGSACLCQSSPGVTDMHCHTWPLHECWG